MSKSDKIKLFVFALAILSIVMNEIYTESRHDKFFNDVRSFMESGGRNTAADGFNLCSQINIIHEELNHFHPLLDCVDIYKHEADQKEE